MAKPLFNCKLAVVALVLLGLSCVNLDIRIIFTDLTSGRVELNYVIEKSVQGLRDSAGALLVRLPTDRAGWDDVVSRTGTATGGQGATVQAFSATPAGDNVRYSVTLGFTSARILENLFTSQGVKLTLLSNAGTFTLNQSFVQNPPAGNSQAPRLAQGNWGALSQLDADNQALFRTLYGNLPVRLEVQAPRAVSSASEGDLSANRRTAVLSRTWNAFLNKTPPAEWRLVW